MTVQIQHLTELVDVELARGLLHLRRASLCAQDLQRLSAAVRLNRSERRTIVKLVTRVRHANAQANGAAEDGSGDVESYGKPSESLTTARPRKGKSGEKPE